MIHKARLFSHSFPLFESEKTFTWIGNYNSGAKGKYKFKKEAVNNYK